jgi:hypothetical protein
VLRGEGKVPSLIFPYAFISYPEKEITIKEPKLFIIFA